MSFRQSISGIPSENCSFANITIDYTRHQTQYPPLCKVFFLRRVYRTVRDPWITD